MTFSLVTRRIHGGIRKADRFADVQMCRYADMQICRCADVRIEKKVLLILVQVKPSIIVFLL